MGKKIKGKSFLIYFIPLLIAGVIKFYIHPIDIMPFNADEAIVALMARHINMGNIPVFFYGQSYMGSLDAILVALGFRAFGEEVWVIRFIQSLLYLGTVFTTMVIAKRLLKSERAVLFTGLMMAVPPINTSLYSTVSLGGYGEMLLIGNLLLLGGISLIRRIKERQPEVKKRDYLGLFLWGLGAGFAFWVIGLTLVYSLPVIILCIWYSIKKMSWKTYLPVLVLFLGSAIGSLPWWFSAVQAGDLGIISELAGGAIKGAGTGSILFRPLQRTLNLVIFGGTVLIGLRPPWDISWLILPLIPIILIFWLTVLVFSIRKSIENTVEAGRIVLTLMGLILSAGFILSPYGDDPSGRYFLPLMIPMVVFGAELLTTQIPKKPIIEYAAILIILLFNIGGTIQSAKAYPPGITTQFDKVAQVDMNYMAELIIFLEENQINTGYSNYWVSYPLAFLSGEEIVFIPRLPYHEDFRYTARDDRYNPYHEFIDNSNKLAYITTNHPQLNEYLRDEFSGIGVNWDEKDIGDFHIFYNLSELVRVDEIGLGVTTTP